MNNLERQQTILNILKNLKGIEPLKELFWVELNYDRKNIPISVRGLNEEIKKLIHEDPILFASAGDDSAFHIIYTRLALDKLYLSPERLIINKLLKEHPHALFIFSNNNQERWHFINVKYDEEDKKRRFFRRITIGPEERLRTASERITMIDTENAQRDLFGIPPLAIQKLHDDAFDVEAITKQFFEDYKKVFNYLQKNLFTQTNDINWAHDYALQFLNRCMFLYFIQRKGWLGGDREFLMTFWVAYNKTKQTSDADTFVENWLKVLFFEAFNNKPIGAHRHFPDNIKNILALAPYLNGGLFSKNTLDEKYKFIISDNLFEQIFTFLERYNFTIAEDSPLDQEVAVDPEMIGKVYESLVNVSDETSERGDAGIFYTPRIEITLMCRLALVDYLANHMGNEHKSLLYELVFAIEPEDKEVIDRKCETLKLWDKLYTLLKDITVLDPACGSGSFLVGMLQILDDLEERAQKYLGTTESPYNRRKRIIGESLYGVDVMDWACHVAELRLWLALIADAEFDRQDLHVRHEPLLPHFSFKIRCGDSLVQEVGGINFGHTHTSHEILPVLKTRITRLKDEKLRFYNNDSERKYRSIDEIRHEELRLFHEILDSRIHTIQEEINKQKKPKYEEFDGSVDNLPKEVKLKVNNMQRKIDELKLELEQIESYRAKLKATKDIPFIWDISFVEIFEGEKEGFDIVIGNPPYVRQENISDPKIPREEITPENKRAYKEKLARSVYHAFPKFFNYHPSTDKASRKLDAKSDLYIYFYFHGLSLLNPKGSFCFITSNSWLDVGYGKDLQEFLLKHCHVKMVIDNQVKRSFASADVNTIIALFSAPDEKKEWALDKIARFIMFKVPFEHILSPVIFEEIEDTREKLQTKEYRLFPIKQNELLIDGSEHEGEEEQDTIHKEQYKIFEKTKEGIVRDKKSKGVIIKSVKYIGNKWGGKYLRAPDIYWTILEKGKGKLVKLGDIAEVRFGIKTGANEFFYLDEEKIREWGIEEEFLKPVISSTHEIEKMIIKKEDSKTYLFSCPFNKDYLKKNGYKNTLAYIEWGEKQKTKIKGKHTIAGVFLPNAPTLKAHKPEWFCIKPHKAGDLIVPRLIRERFFFAYNPEGISNTDMFFHGYIKGNPLYISAILNCTCSYLILEIVGRQGIEGRFNIYGPELKQVYILKCEVLDDNQLNILKKTFLEAGNRNIFKIIDEINQPDRRALDSIIFDALELTPGERDAVYEAVINLVESRLKKAES